MANQIEPKSISELEGMKFFIPSYQRGYRWTQQQVRDLLEDIQEFIEKEREGFYCIQPLVVKKEIPNEKKGESKKRLTEVEESDLLQKTEDIISEYTKWEVIDGQQRLTTIYILLSYLGRNKYYQIEYKTRTDSKEFLRNIDIEKKESNIDYFHMVEAKEQIESWFAEKEKFAEENKKTFLITLLENVKFIWYESVDEDPVKVFTRLNIGKISLTNAELIKALFLNKSNFSNANYNYHKIRLQQQEIAGEWDNIEYTLQNDEFWLFLNKPEYNKPTRIDFIFDLMCEKNTLGLTDNEKIEIGTDEYKTFRYFYTWFKKQGNKINITECWKEIKGFFQIFQEWYNDLELYHYIGFLIENNTDISTIIDEWNKENQTKEKFRKEYIIPQIKTKLKNCFDLDKQYNEKTKTQCRPILLLHNIQTVINQNKNLKENEKYKLPVFYKFPFHLFKKEKWDVEHIDSRTENPLENEIKQKEWLKYSYEYIDDTAKLDNGENLKQEIKKFIKKDPDKKEFTDLWNGVLKSSSSKNSDKLTEEEKNMLWNFTLLAPSINRSYGNDIFPAKRRIIIGKDQGIKYIVSDDLEAEEKPGAIAFVPPCTKHVFLKYFNHSTNNLREWDRQDAETYLENIKKTILEVLEEKEAKNEE
jgi:hypothetical protein